MIQKWNIKHKDAVLALIQEELKSDSKCGFSQRLYLTSVASEFRYTLSLLSIILVEMLLAF